MFSAFTSTYVEATLSRQQPPVAEWEETRKLFDVLTDFLQNDCQSASLVILGSGGTGKTSAMLAGYCHVASGLRNPPLVQGWRFLPVFIPLPRLRDVRDTDELDRRVWQELGVSSREEAENVARLT